MFQGNWKCGGCGGSITELPFQPKGDVGLMCKDCFSKNKGGVKKSYSGGNGEKKMIPGNWACSSCSKAITELPFEPRNTTNLMCKECFKQSRG